MAEPLCSVLCCYVECVHVQVLYLCEPVGTYTSEREKDDVCGLYVHI